MSRLAGRSLWRVMLDTRAGARAPLLRSLGELLRRLHSTPVPRALTESSDWLSRQLLQARKNLAWCDGTAELLTALERTRPEPTPSARPRQHDRDHRAQPRRHQNGGLDHRPWSRRQTDASSRAIVNGNALPTTFSAGTESSRDCRSSPCPSRSARRADSRRRVLIVVVVDRGHEHERQAQRCYQHVGRNRAAHHANRTGGSPGRGAVEA